MITILTTERGRAQVLRRFRKGWTDRQTGVPAPRQADKHYLAGALTSSRTRLSLEEATEAHLRSLDEEREDSRRADRRRGLRW